MKIKYYYLFSLLFTILTFSSCESNAEKDKRIAKENQERLELEEKRKAEVAERTYLLEQKKIELEKREEEERIAKEARLEKERLETAIHDRYINNALSTGATPYSKYYGRNKICDEYGCSQIKVRTSNSDVIVTIKNNNQVVRHAYINSGSSYTFSFPNGLYQIFFYYGKGWNPNKPMKNGEMSGGFISNESFGKDNPQQLNNNVLTYELILQENGNFSTRPSNPNEAL